ncbi:hypothetical protein JTB14_029274 [Gonioctena quinquepunctata]|nr:hypothetical protein JTB14_029274 [Gonioctena quinquepunctata]
MRIIMNDSHVPFAKSHLFPSTQNYTPDKKGMSSKSKNHFIEKNAPRVSTLESSLRKINISTYSLTEISLLSETPLIDESDEDIMPILQRILSAEPEAKESESSNDGIMNVTSQDSYDSNITSDVSLVSRDVQIIESGRQFEQYVPPNTLGNPEGVSAQYFEKYERKPARVTTEEEKDLDFFCVLNGIMNNVFDYTKKGITIRKVELCTPKSCPETVVETLEEGKPPPGCCFCSFGCEDKLCRYVEFKPSSQRCISSSGCRDKSCRYVEFIVPSKRRDSEVTSRRQGCGDREEETNF